MSPAFCTLGTITQSSTSPGAGHHLADVVERELAAHLVDAHHAHLSLPVVGAQRLHHLAARGRLLERSAGVLEVEEHLVGRGGRRLLHHPRVAARAGEHAATQTGRHGPSPRRRRAARRHPRRAAWAGRGCRRRRPAGAGRRRTRWPPWRAARCRTRGSGRRPRCRRRGIGKPRPLNSLASSSGPPRSSWTRSIMRISSSWIWGSPASFSWTPPSWPMRSLTAASWATCISTGWLDAATTVCDCSRRISKPRQARQVPWCWQRQSWFLRLSSSRCSPLRSTPPP